MAGRGGKGLGGVVDWGFWLVVGLDLGGRGWLGIGSGWASNGVRRRLGQRGWLGFERAGLAWDSTGMVEVRWGWLVGDLGSVVG